ncbi:hypothetical protein PPMP20_00445 [Paraburkholderia phymatum]|uniref:hypothetical protein n=1 Tax=Paraburkholderia phymatum TaxID=148447 RepID=UPI0002EC63C8|nr:hypothetical protein [Paraburkholderia phymatum]
MSARLRGADMSIHHLPYIANGKYVASIFLYVPSRRISSEALAARRVEKARLAR